MTIITRNTISTSRVQIPNQRLDAVTTETGDPFVTIYGYRSMEIIAQTPVGGTLEISFEAAA